MEEIIFKEKHGQDLKDFERLITNYSKSQLAEMLMESQKENQKYKEVIYKVSSQIKLYGKYNGEKCTRGFSMMTADINKLLDILKEVEHEKSNN